MTVRRGVFIIPAVIALVLLAIPAAYAVREINKPKLVRPNSHQSNPKAKIKIVTFVDYECPPCVDAHETTKKVIAKNPGEINLVVRHRIGESHVHAELATNAAEAAADQGKFFEMNDKLLENQKEWSSQENPQDTFVKYANELGLDSNRYTQDFLSEKYAKIIKTDEKDAGGLGVDVIPTTFINGKNVGYAPSEETLNSEISFLKNELENIEDDPDYNQDPNLILGILEILILAGAPLIIIIGGLIVIGRIRDAHKRAEKIRKRIGELESRKKNPKP